MFIMWLVVHGGLLTEGILLNIQVEDAKCCLCQHFMTETSKHLFVECEYVKALRDELISWFDVSLPAKIEGTITSD